MFLVWGVSIPFPNPKARVSPLVRYLQLLIQYTGIYPPYLEVLSSICNLRTLHAMVTGTHITWTDEYQHSKLFRVWSCCCCETQLKLNNMLTLGYALFVLQAPNSVGTYQAVNPNNAVSNLGRPESPATPLSELGWKLWTWYILFTTGFGSQLLWWQQLNSDQISDY